MHKSISDKLNFTWVLHWSNLNILNISHPFLPSIIPASHRLPQHNRRLLIVFIINLILIFICQMEKNRKQLLRRQIYQHLIHEIQRCLSFLIYLTHYQCLDFSDIVHSHLKSRIRSVLCHLLSAHKYRNLIVLLVVLRL